MQDELDKEKEARLWLISDDHGQRVKDAEEGQRRAEEAAVRIRGEADYSVETQAAQLNKAKALNDAYRARYGELDKGKSANTSTTTASRPNANQDGNDLSSMYKAGEGRSQASADADSISSQSAAAWVSHSLQRSTSSSN